jgi:hypothetical protein
MALKTNTRNTNKEKFSKTLVGLVLTAIVIDTQKAENLPMYQGWMTRAYSFLFRVIEITK